MTPDDIGAYQTTIISFESINRSCKHYCVSIFQQKVDPDENNHQMSYFKAKGTKFDFGWGSAPDPARELTALHQTPYLDLRGLYF